MFHSFNDVILHNQIVSHPFILKLELFRDVKPENIVLEGGKSGGRVFLVDFGGVQAVASTEAFSMGSTIIGTYGYMAPEQFRGSAQPASDLYGLGGTLLYLLSGKGFLKKSCVCFFPVWIYIH